MRIFNVAQKAKFVLRTVVSFEKEAKDQFEDVMYNREGFDLDGSNKNGFEIQGFDRNGLNKGALNGF